MFSRTPPPPYVAVIFTSLRTEAHGDEYSAMAAAMEALAQSQPGYLGIESARGADRFGISVSYFATVEHARAWKQNAEHVVAQRLGREKFYAAYRVRVAVVEREYGRENDREPGFEMRSPAGDE